LFFPSSSSQISFAISQTSNSQTLHSNKQSSKMHFTSLFTPVVALLATAVSASPIEKRAVTADQMVTTINKITQQSKSLTTIANKINPMNGVPLLGPSSGSGSTNFNDVITGFQGIITTGTTAITNMEGTQPYTNAAEEQKVCDAFADVSVRSICNGVTFSPLTLSSSLPFTRTCSRLSLASLVFCRVSSSVPSLLSSARSKMSSM
jgi:hypothetical protein